MGDMIDFRGPRWTREQIEAWVNEWEVSGANRFHCYVQRNEDGTALAFAEDGGAYLTVALGRSNDDGWLIDLTDDGSCRLRRQNKPAGRYRTLWAALQAIAPTDFLVAA